MDMQVTPQKQLAVPAQGVCTLDLLRRRRW